MASISVDIITSKLMPVEEFHSRLDPQAMSKELNPVLGEISNEIISEIAKTVSPEIWKLTPALIKDGINQSVNSQAPRLLTRLLDDLRDNIDKLFDVKGLVVHNLTGRNTKNIVDMFQKVGSTEFKFIEMSGLYFGFIFGIMQMCLYLILAEGWTLPVAGVIVGYATNWLALKMIFRPQEPRRFGPITYQGLFHKRQDAVSKEYAHLVGTRILSARQITNHMMFGSGADLFWEIMLKNISVAVDDMSDMWKAWFFVTVGEKRYHEIKESTIDKLRYSVPSQVRTMEPYVDRALDLSNTLYSRLRSLSPMEFERILRSAFQEDELLLMIVGAILGAMAGLLQWFAFFM